MATQLPLPLPVRPARGREDYFVSQTNAVAVATIDAWQHWAGGKCALIGPEGAGKTHLVHVWAGLAGASITAAADLPQADIPSLSGAPVAVEDVDRIAGDRAAEEALFHLHNLCLAEGGALLVTARSDPTHWPLVLPDLASRMAACQIARLGDPDDTLLGALLVKLFADHQIVPAADVVAYLTKRMPRRYQAAQDIVELLDHAALARRCGITRPLAADVLAEFAARSDTP